MCTLTPTFVWTISTQPHLFHNCKNQHWKRKLFLDLSTRPLLFEQSVLSTTLFTNVKINTEMLFSFSIWVQVIKYISNLHHILWTKNMMKIANMTMCQLSSGDRLNLFCRCPQCPFWNQLQNAVRKKASRSKVYSVSP